MLLLNDFTTMSINGLNLSNNENVDIFIFRFFSIQEDSFRILPQVNALEIEVFF